MIKTDLPYFASSNLATAIAEVNDVFDNHQDDINHVSSDIRQLESYLQSKNVVVPYEDNWRSRKDSRLCYTLSWTEHNGKFRLICKTERSVDPDEWSAWEHVDSRPLIDCPLHVRLELYPKLSGWARGLSKAITVFSRPKDEAEDPFVTGEEAEIPF